MPCCDQIFRSFGLPMCKWQNDFKNKNVNFYPSPLTLLYAFLAVSSLPRPCCARTRDIPADPYTLEKSSSSKSCSGWHYQQLFWGSCFSKSQASRVKGQDVEFTFFFVKINCICTRTRRMTWKFGHNSAMSRAFQQVIVLDPTLSGFGGKGGSRIYLGPCTLGSRYS